MPRVDPWCDGGIRFWTDEEFYRADKVEAVRAQKSMTSWVAPVVAAVETTLFALGPEGLVLSATIGFAFAMLQPPKVVTYNESVRTAVRKAVTEGLTNAAVTKAANDVRDFHGDLETMQLFTASVNKDDFRALEMTVLDHLFKVVQTGGALQVAFDTLCDNLSFDGSDRGNHLQWIAVAILSIFQAYWIRCTAYCQLARQYRRINDFHNYNAQLNSLRIAYEGLQKHLPELLQQAEDRIEAAKKERVASVKVDYDTFEPDWVMRNFGSAEKETVRATSFVHDFKSEQRLEVAGLWPGRDYTDGMGIKSDHNDSVLESVAVRNMADYIKHLEASMTRDATPLRENLHKLLELFNNFVKGCQSSSPKYAPLPIGFVHMGVTSSVPQGTHQSFRVLIVDTEGKAIGSPSPWSDWITTKSQTQLHQFLIGDGFAMADTSRQIYLRARAPGMPTFGIEGEQGVLVDTIRGHGLMLWPEDSSEGWI